MLDKKEINSSINNSMRQVIFSEKYVVAVIIIGKTINTNKYQ